MQQCSFDRNIVQFYGMLSLVQCSLLALFLKHCGACCHHLEGCLAAYCASAQAVPAHDLMCSNCVVDACRLLCEPSHACAGVHGGRGPVVSAEGASPGGAAVVRPRPQPRSGHRQGPALPPRAQGKILLLFFCSACHIIDIDRVNTI